MAWAERLIKRQPEDFVAAGSSTGATVHLLSCAEAALATGRPAADLRDSVTLPTLLALSDLTGAILSVSAGYLIAQTLGDTAAFLSVAPLLCVAIAACLLHAGSHSHYTHGQPVAAHIFCLSGASAIGLCATLLLVALAGHLTALVPTGVVWISFPLLCLAARAIARWVLMLSGLDRNPVILVGDEAGLANAATTLAAASHLGFDVAAEVSLGALARNLSAGGWRKLLGHHQAKRVVLVHDAADTLRPPPHMIEALVRERVPVTILHTTHGLPALGCQHGWFIGHDALMVSYGTQRAKPLARAVKTAMDLCAASVALLILLPAFLVIAALVKADGGPAFFSHSRIGHNGRRFNCLKFRTMVTDSEAVLRRALEESPVAAAEWAATRKLRDDPRITPIGRFLRKTSLDELPQLLNVLRLEMSLVGPRPIVRDEVCRYGDDIGYYYETRPGITGLWQVSGRSNTSYSRRVELDRWYVKNWTLGQDLAILAQTIPAVILRRGAA